MFSSKTLQLFLSITAFAAISSPTSVLAAPRHSHQSKSSKKRKSSKSAPPLPGDLPPPCEGLGDPVYGPGNPVPQPVLPSEFVRSMTVPSFGGKIVILDTAGAVDISGPNPCPSTNNAYPDDAFWCNAEGQSQYRLTAQATCLHSITDDYYFIKYVETEYINPAGKCTLVQVSRKAPGTWTEYNLGTAGPAIEWAYDAEPVGMSYKFSLCPNPGEVDTPSIVANFD